MPKEFLGDRRKALEDSFFDLENKKILAEIRAKKAQQAARSDLQESLGITDEAVLDRLIELEIDTATWAAVALAPLIEVAWADGRVDEKERRAVLTAAEANGVSSGSPGFQLLESWLARRPDGRLIAAWGEYMVGLCAKLTAAERHSLRDEVLGRARTVAEAAGGVLGLGNKVSREEEVILAELAKAFEAPAP